MHAHPTRVLLIVLAALLAVVAIVYTIWRVAAPVPSVEQAPFTVQQAFPKNAPPPMPKDYVTAQNGFQYLVSYTDSGFIPAQFSIKNAETVRFTNNSGTTLRLFIANTPLVSLGRGAYFEYTFTKTGVATFSDGTLAHLGTVTIK
ncbi:MAG: hypothetical protein WC050_01545 [Candidatus Paceibacterota bacterium]